VLLTEIPCRRSADCQQNKRESIWFSICSFSFCWDGESSQCGTADCQFPVCHCRLSVCSVLPPTVSLQCATAHCQFTVCYRPLSVCSVLLPTVSLQCATAHCQFAVCYCRLSVCSVLPPTLFAVCYCPLSVCSVLLATVSLQCATAYCDVLYRGLTLKPTINHLHKMTQ
jgi:hypothetical protein